MERINDVLCSIFEINNFTRHTINKSDLELITTNIEFYSPMKSDQDIMNNDYYLIVNISNKSNLAYFLDEQQKIYEYILKSFSNYVHLRKNLTAIICLDTDMQFIRDKTSPTHLELQKVEEDPYYFRKIVLTYNSNQLKAYSEKFADTNIELLQKYVSLPTNFNNYKELLKSNGNELNSDLYCFISNLFLAIPFLNIEAQTFHKSNIINDFRDALGGVDSDNVKLLDIIEKIDLTQINETLFDESSKYANELRDLLK